MSSSDYVSEIKRAMLMLAEDSRTVFIGQTVRYPGTSMSGTLSEIPEERRIEFPVAEETQMGVSIGLAISGKIPVSIFTRWNFLLLATNQLVNHLDKIPLFSEYRPKVIIRTGIGSEHPMYPGVQHTGDMTDAFRLMCKTIRFIKLERAEDIYPAYQKALEFDGSTVLVEISDRYND